jgi:hypothetical protein
VLARLKQNLTLLTAAVRARFDGQLAQGVFQEGDDRVEVWDDDHFDPWETLVVENGAVPGFGYQEEAGMTLRGPPESLGMGRMEKTAPKDAAGCIIDTGQDGKTEILDEWSRL